MTTEVAHAVQERGQEIESLKASVADVIDEALRCGATAVEAGLSVDQGLTVTVRKGDVETIEHHRSQGLGITVYYGQRKGSASTTDLRPDALIDAVAAACRIARYGMEDPCAGLPEQSLLATEFPALDLYHPWEISVDEAIRWALECEQAALTYDPRISNSEGANLSTHDGIRVLGNSLGFLHGYASSQHSLGCAVIGNDASGAMQRDDWWTVARAADGLESPEAVGRKAADRTVKRLGARSLTTRQCPVLYVPEAAKSLLGHFLGAIRGGNLYRKSSFLLDALGQAIFPAGIRIHEQPHLPRALGSAPYDREGVAVKARDVVSDGVLQSYVLSSYSARKLGMVTTGNAGGLHNVTLEPGELDFEGLLRAMGTGLVVTELLGQGVNGVTGDYSRGAAGFWVDGGAIQYPVEEITVAGNLKEMYRNILAVGNDVDRRGNVRTGSILVERMTVAGN